MTIPEFIDNLKLWHSKDAIIREIIFDYHRLEQTLHNLDSLIEMYPVKSVIVTHIQMLIVMAYKAILSGKSVENCYKGDMLHTVFYGHPGVGKSRTAKYLAEVWKALGILRSKKGSFILEQPLSKEDALKKVNDIRHSFLDLYEKCKANPKSTSKQSELWDAIKGKLKHFGDELARSNLEEKIEEENDLIVICGRENFVAEYAGQTSIKTSEFLKKNLGKCIIIEEAYLLYNGDNDTYGMEAITILNRFMDEHADSLIIIFTGYEELLHKTIFKAQPGLKRRCQWIFNLQGYSPEGLSKIFETQIKKFEWIIDKDVNLIKFFETHMNDFSNYGGDTERLALHCKIIHSRKTFKDLLSIIDEEKKIKSEHLQFVMTTEMLEESFKEYKTHRL
jgi:hypothetical protein